VGLVAKMTLILDNKKKSYEVNHPSINTVFYNDMAMWKVFRLIQTFMGECDPEFEKVKNM